MLIDILLEIGLVFLGLLAFSQAMDVLLSDAQKERLSRKVEHLWYWLDEHSQTSYLLRLQRAKKWIVLTGIALAVCYALWTFFGRRGETDVVVVEFIVLVALSLMLGWWFVGITLKARTLLGASIRALLLAGLSILPFAISAGAAWHFTTALTPQGGGVTLLQMLWVIVWIVSVLFAGLMLLFLAALVLPLLFFVALALFLKSSEFVVRRVAEYPRGPVVAVGVLAAAILALAKVFRT